MKKKHAAVRAALIFLGVMAAVTFFSRTLRYAMIPKVEVAYAVGGTLKWNCQSDQLQLKSTESTPPGTKANYEWRKFWRRKETRCPRAMTLCALRPRAAKRR